MGSSASAYPDLSRDRERSRGSGFSEEGSAPSHVSRFGAPGSGFGAAPAASYPAAPPQVSHPHFHLVLLMIIGKVGERKISPRPDDEAILGKRQDRIGKY